LSGSPKDSSIAYGFSAVEVFCGGQLQDGSSLLKRSGQLWPMKTFGILRCAQDDSKNKQQQKQATAGTSNSKNKQQQKQATAGTSNSRNKQQQGTNNQQEQTTAGTLQLLLQ